MYNIDAVVEEVDLSVPFLKMKLDLSHAANMGPEEAREIVDMYYTLQKSRIAANNQIKSAEKQDQPREVLNWIYLALKRMELEAQKALKAFADNNYMGVWAQGIIGIGPVIAAGLIAHIDIRKAPYVGNIWSYGGVSGSMQKKWEKGQKRPWNATFKTLLWKIGESFVKVKGNPDSLYGKFYTKWRVIYDTRNESGQYAELSAQKAKEVGKNTIAYQYYSKGKLPPGHIYARAKRKAVKLFIAHWHEMAYRNHFGTEPPMPFISQFPSPFEAIGKPHDPANIISAKDAK